MSAPATEFLVLLRPVRAGMVVDGPLPEELPVLAAHRAWLEQMASEGRVVLAGRTREADPSTFGIAILRAASDAEAREIAGRDPAVAGGLMTAQVRPFRIAVGGG